MQEHSLIRGEVACWVLLSQLGLAFLVTSTQLQQLWTHLVVHLSTVAALRRQVESSEKSFPSARLHLISPLVRHPHSKSQYLRSSSVKVGIRNVCTVFLHVVSLSVSYTYVRDQFVAS